MDIYRNYEDPQSVEYWKDVDRRLGREVKAEDYQPSVKKRVGPPPKGEQGKSQSRPKK